jgi:hypothetical protein
MKRKLMLIATAALITLGSATPVQSSSGIDYIIRYYTDHSYTTQVGQYIMMCDWTDYGSGTPTAYSTYEDFECDE